MLLHLSQQLKIRMVKKVPREMLQEPQKAAKNLKAQKTTLKRLVKKMQPSPIKTLPRHSIVV